MVDAQEHTLLLHMLHPRELAFDLWWKRLRCIPVHSSEAGTPDQGGDGESLVCVQRYLVLYFVGDVNGCALHDPA